MPYPYAYYREEYNGPLHGTELESQVLYLTTSLLVNASGEINVAGKSHIHLDATSGNMIIDNLTGGKDGQIIFVHKDSVTNSVTIKNNNGSSNRVYSSSNSDIVIPSGRHGGIVLICRDGGASQDWFEVSNNGLIGDGSVTAPSLAFASESMTGIYKAAAATMAFATSGIEKFTINSAYIRSLVPHRFLDGSSAQPSIAFENDPDTGFKKTTDAVVYVADALDKVSLFKDGTVGFEAPHLRSDLPFRLWGAGGSGVQKIYTGGVLSSDTYGDASLVPVDGIYSKGNVRTAGQFIGTATSALYADLAENYRADSNYKPGTLVCIGGAYEITVASNGRVFGVISSNPGFLLNASENTGEVKLPVALFGKVPCRVIGTVLKGDPIGLHPTIPGVAIAGYEPKVGIALENKDTEEEGLILISTRAVI